MLLALRLQQTSLKSSRQDVLGHTEGPVSMGTFECSNEVFFPHPTVFDIQINSKYFNDQPEASLVELHIDIDLDNDSCRFGSLGQCTGCTKGDHFPPRTTQTYKKLHLQF